MSKYKPLSDHLAGHAGDEWRTSFTDVEAMLGFPLPKAARSGAAWWASTMEKTSRDWRVGDVDRAGGLVTFRRSEISPIALEAATHEPQHAQPATDAPAAPGPQAAGSAKVQPEAMRRAAESASRGARVRKAAPMMAAGIAVVAGVAALVARTMRRDAS